jgi:hypothetical protein
VADRHAPVHDPPARRNKDKAGLTGKEQQTCERHSFAARHTRTVATCAPESCFSISTSTTGFGHILLVSSASLVTATPTRAR